MSVLRIGLVGLGTVGATVAGRLLDGAVRGAELTAVSARDRNRDRGIDLSAQHFADNPLDLVNDDAVDVVVELAGGADGMALDLVSAALAAGKPVVTANKALLAAHADALSALSAHHNVPLAYEAAVAGGIPVIKALREGLAGNDVARIGGILNGTCNYILTQMAAYGASFDAALADAQDKGFAEADPTLDVSGADAAQKLSLLAALAFGLRPDTDVMPVTGIAHLTALDIELAAQFDCVVRLVAQAQKQADGVYAEVTPMLVKNGDALAHVVNETNAVAIHAAPLGDLFLQGPGAGGGATASAVLADIADLAQGFGRPAFARPSGEMSESVSQVPPAREWYLRLQLADKPGSMATATQILAENGVSIEEVVQRSRNEDDSYLPAVFITHHTAHAPLSQALAALRQQTQICKDVVTLPVYGAGFGTGE